MSAPAIQIVRAKNLHAADFCLASKQTVIRITHHALSIPSGKVEVELERQDGRRRVALWNRETRIGIARRGPSAAAIFEGDQ